MKDAINDVYSMINKASDPLISKIEGIIRTVSKRHRVSVASVDAIGDTTDAEVDLGTEPFEIDDDQVEEE